jgi:hypothetical protein
MATSMWLSRPFGDFAAMQVAAGDVAHRFVHRLVVVGRRNDQVGHRDQVVFIDAVVVEQRAARRFDDADAFHLALALDHQVALSRSSSCSSSLITSAACSISIIRVQW